MINVFPDLAMPPNASIYRSATLIICCDNFHYYFVVVKNFHLFIKLICGHCNSRAHSKIYSTISVIQKFLPEKLRFFKEKFVKIIHTAIFKLITYSVDIIKQNLLIKQVLNRENLPVVKICVRFVILRICSHNFQFKLVRYNSFYLIKCYTMQNTLQLKHFLQQFTKIAELQQQQQTSQSLHQILQKQITQYYTQSDKQKQLQQTICFFTNVQSLKTFRSRIIYNM
eukprot:TRINITY_DN13746_c0_g1_i2.p1 TRINITY_DN13746_c0_g1~~TRINITY_DN13746_c0_g1_i2.p1  ORF type:complete len:226 (+),score=-24.50 TRINITY_DN13746_c0_g1_i2:1-678(+)